MTNEAEAAVKAHIWTVDQVGTSDSFLSTWIWLPYRVKEALAMSIKGGLLTMLTQRGANREWPHWTSAGLKSLSQLAEVPDENWHKGTHFGKNFVAEAVEGIEECLDSMYLRMWAEIAGYPERVVDNCIRDMVEFAYEGDFEFEHFSKRLLPVKLQNQLSSIEEAIYYQASRHTIGQPAGDSKEAMLSALEEARSLLNKDGSEMSISDECFSDDITEALRWLKTGRLPRIRQRIPEEEVGLSLLAGRRLSSEENRDILGDRSWRRIRNRLAALHEEGNARFDALDATLMAKHICKGKGNIRSIFDYYKGGPEGTAQAYCVKCREEVDIMGTQLVTLKSKRLTIMGTCPECGTRVFRFVSRKGFEKGG